MSEMLERAKRAVFVSMPERLCDWSTPDHPECEHMARTLIDALREPTPEMIKAGGSVVVAKGDSEGDYNGEIGDYEAEMAYCAMIEAALDEKAP